VNWSVILKFASKNWKEILVVLSLLAVSIKTRMDYRALNKAYEISKEETEERIEALHAIHSEEIARREYAIEEYKKQLDELRENYEESREDLEREKQKKTKEYERQFTQDKEALANAIISTFNFEYVE
jgi:molecular chaperone GrpE (heat shock protein)